MNIVTIIGTMTKDIEVRYSQSGTPFGSFGIAYNERYVSNGEKVDKAHFFNVDVIGKTAETINQYFKKGSRIGITGSLQQSSWEKDGKKQSTVSIKLDKFDFIDKNESNKSTAQKAPEQSFEIEIDVENDSIPF